MNIKNILMDIAKLPYREKIFLIKYFKRCLIKGDDYCNVKIKVYSLISKLDFSKENIIEIDSMLCLMFSVETAVEDCNFLNNLKANGFKIFIKKDEWNKMIDKYNEGNTDSLYLTFSIK